MIPQPLRTLLGRAADSPLPLPPGVEVRRGRWIPELGGRLTGGTRPALAVAVGDTIVVHPEVELTERLLRHELAHVRQWRARPWTFAARYVWWHLRYGYGANPYEIEAREAEAIDVDG